MKKLLLALLCLISFSLTLGANRARTEVFTELGKTMELEKPPLDIAGTPEGKYTFILLEGGKVVIYSADGEKNEMQVDPNMDRIFTAGLGDKVYVSSRQGKKVQEINVDFLQHFNTAGAPFKGAENAAIELVVFSDFECPHCAALPAVLEQILQKNPKTVKLAFKHYPLANHRFAGLAALASVAALEQGKFWEYHDLLFKNNKDFSPTKFEELAKQLGLNMPQFQATFNGQDAKTKVGNDLMEGRNAGITGTPSLYLNGRIVRNHTLAAIQQAIDNKAGEAKHEGAAKREGGGKK